MTRPALVLALVAAAAIAAAAIVALSGPDNDLLEPLSAGSATTPLTNRNAFGQAIGTLSTEDRRRFEVGDSLFTLPWVTAPASTEGRDGLGATFNARACASCHIRDGRASQDDPFGLLLRLSGPGGSPHAAYGDQLQDLAVQGVPAEGTVSVEWATLPGSHADGTPFALRSPTYAIEDPAFGPLDDVLLSPRIAPPVFGAGLLEAVPEDAIRALADPDDADGDGISGRVNEIDGRLGRFGWKANQPTVASQTADAFAGDIGITSSLVPDENCPPVQVACAQAPTGGSPELTDSQLEAVVFYVSTLAVPARRGVDDPAVRSGAGHFGDLGCASCHIPTLTTGDHPIEELSGVTIHAFTDLLLHDMGPGLADGRPDGEASGSEWRTPPLWGIGLTDTVNGHMTFLHDGRARSLEEAILWHGGEAEAAKVGFTRLGEEERAELIAFLESL